jgi:hypothetical protein
MGLKCLPDFMQETMENIFRNINDAEVYINDIGAFSPNWEHHLKLLCTILTKLQENSFTVNPLICNWVVTPLTLQTGAPKKGQIQPKYVWTKKMQAAFDQMKVIMAMDVLCAYPNQNKLFHIYTNTSDYQLGLCIMQDGQPVAYYLFNGEMNPQYIEYLYVLFS